MKKNGFTRSQIEIIETVEKYLADGMGFSDAVMLTHVDLRFEDWYIRDTFLSYKEMVIMTS